MRPSAATFFVDNQTLNVSYGIEQDSVISGNLLDAFYLKLEKIW